MWTNRKNKKRVFIEENKDINVRTADIIISVINWVKQAADKIRKRRKVKNEKTDILELGEMCVSYKRNMAPGRSKQNNKEACWFFVGDRSPKNFEKLCKNISHIDATFYATDKYSAYDVIPPDKHLIGKST